MSPSGASGTVSYNITEDSEFATLNGNVLTANAAGTVTSGDKTFDTLNIEGIDFDIEPVYLPDTFKITTGTTYNVEAYLIGATSTYAAIVLTSLTAA